MFFLPGESERPFELAKPAQSWSEAWGAMAEATDAMMTYRDNANASEEANAEAYDRRIRAIREATGETVDNPVRLYGDGWRPKPVSSYSFDSESEQLRRHADEKLAQWDARMRELARKHPDKAALFAGNPAREALDVTREASQDFDKAAGGRELGAVGRTAAILYGGARGMLKDPTQVAMLFAGAPAAAGRTAWARIGRTMLYEGAINAGAEAAVQTLAEPWRQRAGVGSDWRAFFLNVGLAGALGGAGGGVFQGAPELARALRLPDDTVEPMARVLANQPEPGDVERIAAATGRTLNDEERAMAARAFEEDALDGFMAPPDAPPDRLAVMEAARRHAEDPDNFPPPEAVERALAERRSGTLTTADYERLYDLQPEPPSPPERLAPATAHEPRDDAELVRAADVAGRGDAAAEAAIVASPAKREWTDLIADSDEATGAPVFRTVDEALAEADIFAFHADLLEACKS